VQHLSLFFGEPCGRTDRLNCTTFSHYLYKNGNFSITFAIYGTYHTCFVPQTYETASKMEIPNEKSINVVQRILTKHQYSDILKIDISSIDIDVGR